jgi:hypothetical protein
MFDIYCEDGLESEPNQMPEYLYMVFEESRHGCLYITACKNEKELTLTLQTMALDSEYQFDHNDMDTWTVEGDGSKYVVLPYDGGLVNVEDAMYAVA